MTDPKAQADAIDPRVTVWPPDIADCIAASDTTSSMTPKAR